MAFETEKAFPVNDSHRFTRLDVVVQRRNGTYVASYDAMSNDIEMSGFHDQFALRPFEKGHAPKVVLEITEPVVVPWTADTH